MSSDEFKLSALLPPAKNTYVGGWVVTQSVLEDGKQRAHVVVKHQRDRLFLHYRQKNRSSASSSSSTCTCWCVCGARVRICQSFLNKCGAKGRYVNIFKPWVRETVNQRVQQAVAVRQNHEGVVPLDGYVFCILPVLQPHKQQCCSGYSAGKEAEGEDDHNRRDQAHSPPQLSLLPNRLLPQPVDNADRAVDEDDVGDDDLGEENDLKKTNKNKHYQV